MKINKIMLENFRSFKGKHEIEFAPINLFFGANSVGKSSVFKAFNNFNKLKEKDIFIGESFASVSLTFGADILQESWRKYSDSEEIGLLEIIEEKEFALDFFRNFQLNTKSFFVKHGVTVKKVENKTLHIDYKQYGLNDTWFFEYYAGEEHPFEFDKIRINLEHPIFESHPFLKLKSSRESFEILNACFGRINGEEKGYATYLLTKVIHEQAKDSFSQNRGVDLDSLISVVHKYLEKKSMDDYRCIHKTLPVLVWIVRTILKTMPDLEQLVHLGPLRKIPELVNDSAEDNKMGLEYFSRPINDQERNNNYTGEAAWKSIFSSFKYNTNEEIDLALKNETRIPLEKQVNAWLLDWFNTPYEIQFHKKFVFTVDSAEKLQKLNAGKLSLEDLSTESARVVFRNVQNGSVSPAKDIGVGISQLTPVIVNALKSRSFSVEQPELHIHPRMQTVLGDLFVFEGLFSAVEDAGEFTVTTRDIEGKIQEHHFNRKKVQDESFILVETHSEHLILRLLKRLREGILKPEDLAIYYFENDKGKAISSRIGVDSDGEFTTPWPEGFFEERLEELF